jgi:hypothetical protein
MTPVDLVIAWYRLQADFYDAMAYLMRMEFWLMMMALGLIMWIENPPQSPTC